MAICVTIEVAPEPVIAPDKVIVSLAVKYDCKSEIWLSVIERLGRPVICSGVVEAK